MNTNHVALVGDSTIDNIVWVKKVESSVPGVLKELLPSWKITNYAADGFTTTNVLEGATPFISCHTRKYFNDPFPNDDHFAPLEELEILHTHTPISHIVLSVGGNDVRVILGRIDQLFQVTATFYTNYETIVKRLLQITPRLIIMTQYRPSLYQDNYGVYRALSKVPMLPGTGTQKINFLMTMMYKNVLTLARQNKIPILDLSNSFEPRYAKLFLSQIEPSALGSQLIGHLISHILENHNFEGDSVIYSAVPKNYDLIDSKVVVNSVDSTKNEENFSWTVVDDNSVTPEQIRKWCSKSFIPPTEEKEEIGEYSAQQKQLEQMGFVDKVKNLNLLREYDGNVDAVVNRLLG